MQRKSKGFTLLELIFVIVLLGIISVVAGRIVLQSMRNFQTAQNISDADWQGYIALSYLADDIHNIRSAGDISTITSSQLTFTNMSGSSVQYQLSGSNLTRGGTILASGVTGLTFSYLNSSGATTATASAVRYISIALTLTQGTTVTSYSTLVATRGMQ